MTPKDKDRSAGELEEDSCTRRKRLRRVSFAETTVHVFKRDEESDSPASLTPVVGDKCRSPDNESTVGLEGLRSHGDDSMECSPVEDEEEDGMRMRFVNVTDSYSPGSAVGSVVSNEDEDFFGPISRSFIDSRRLSESGMSDDYNHDITLDSTAFSLHFRNIAPPGEHSANSAGSLRTPTGDTLSCMPQGFERDQIEDFTSKCPVGQVTNVSEDWNRNSPTISRSRSYDYEKLSRSLEALRDEVNLSMQQNCPNGVHKACSHRTDEVGRIWELGKDGTKDGNKNSFCDKPGRVIHCTSSVGKPVSNESLISAKSDALTSNSNSEKMQEIFCHVASGEHAEVNEARSPETFIAIGQHSEVLSTSHRELHNCLNGQSCQIEQEFLRSTTEAKSCPDSSLHCISAALSVEENAEQDLETVNTPYTPKSNAKSFHSSTPIEKTSFSQGQETVNIAYTPAKNAEIFYSSSLKEKTSFSQVEEQQHLPSQTVPPSSNFLCISSGKKSATPMNNVKAFQHSSSHGSSFQLKQRQLFDFSIQSQSESKHNSAREQSASLKWESMEHGETSPIKNHITRSEVKSRGQPYYQPEPSMNGPVISVLQHSTNDTSNDPNLKFAVISDVNVDGAGVITSKTESMDVIRPLDFSGNVGYLTELDKNASLENINISMQTPKSFVKTFQFSTLKGSVSSFKAKRKQLQYGSVLSLNKSMHSSAIELSASLKMEFIKHEERLSSIKSRITRSIFKSTMQTDLVATPSKKGLLFTDFQGTFKENNNGYCVEDHGISDVHMDANKLSANKQMEVLEICNDSICSGNDSYSAEFDKNVPFIKSVENGQSKKCIELYNDSSIELPHSLDAYASALEQRVSDLKVSSRALDISCEHPPKNKDNSAISSNGHVTSGAKEMTNSSYLLEHNSMHPTISLVGLSVERANGIEDLVVPLSGSNLVHNEKTDVGLKQFHVGSLHSNTRLNEFSVNMPNKTIERSIIGSYCKQNCGENLEANAKSSKLCESPAKKIDNSFEYPNSHSVNKMDLVSPKKSTSYLSYCHNVSHQDSESQHKTCYDSNTDVIGDTGLQQTLLDTCCSESYSIYNRSVTDPEVKAGSTTISIDHIHHDETLDIAVKAPQNCWTDVLSKLSDTTNQLLPLSISELNIHKLRELETLLDELQIARKYEGLLFNLRNQNHLSDLHNKRVIDARSLLEKLSFLKARKQLKCMKLKKLRITAQFLHSKVDECAKLKSSYTQLFNPSTRAIERDETTECKDQDESNRLTAMKQELGILEENIKILVKSLEASCKLTGKMSCNDVIKTVDEHVMRKALCQEIQQHLQLWKLRDVVLKNDHYEVILDYCNLFFQRFTINKNRFSNIVANNFCNAANITKKFPNMDACIAFEFVFKLNVDHKLMNADFIHERTVETNLIMGTLIDVLEEILLSRLELWNLLFSTFLMPSSSELELQLCFYSSSNGKKLIFGLDMTNLNRAIYPANPSELKLQVHKQQTTFPLSVVNEAIRAVRSLDCGPRLILRLCRCVSQVVSCSS